MTESDAMIPVLEESQEAPPLPITYCRPVTGEEYERQSVMITERAVKELVGLLEKEPEIFRKLLKKRKQDEIENAGVFSCIKAKLLSMIQGSKYKGNEVTDDEFMEKFTELKSGMMMALGHTKDTLGRRYSHRLAAKEGKENQPSPRFQPPAPPPQPSIQVQPRPPLRDRNHEVKSLGITMKPALRPKQELDDSFAEKSMASVHRELLKSNPHFRLRSASKRSPGRTPYKHKGRSRTQQLANTTASTLNLSSMSIEQSLHQAFVDIMQNKFKNARSPSPLSSPSSAAGMPGNTEDDSFVEWQV